MAISAQWYLPFLDILLLLYFFFLSPLFVYLLTFFVSFIYISNHTGTFVQVVNLMRQRNETLWGKDSMEFNPEREWKGKQIESEWSEHRVMEAL